MNPRVLLRIAAAVAFVQFIAHTFLLVTYVPKHGPEEVALVEAMKSHYFKFGGFAHSYWEMYFGYGLFAAGNCLIEAVLFWQLAILAKTDSLRIRPMVALFLFANIGYAILVYKYFFLKPLFADAVIAMVLALALITARPGSSAQQIQAA